MKNYDIKPVLKTLQELLQDKRYDDAKKFIDDKIKSMERKKPKEGGKNG